MQTRDLLLLIACAVGILVSLNGDTGWTLDRTHVVHIDTALYANRRFPAPSELLPKPIISDIDGDGVKEVVYATREPKVYVADLRPELTMDALQDAEEQRVVEAPVRAETSLLSALRVVSGREPVALGTGYLEVLEDDPEAVRRQVIVVVTHGWSILLFDHNLNLLWETNLSQHIPQGFYHREITILVCPNKVRNDDTGLVVVAGRMDYHRDAAIRWHAYEDTSDVTAPEDTPDDPLSDSSYDDEEKHFSYYAFDGATGGLRWKHEASDFHDAVFDEEILYPQHSYKLHVKNNVKHVGEVDWTTYRDDVLAHLPHRWTRRDDTKLSPARFNPQRKGYASAPSESSGAEDVGLPPSFLHGLGLTSLAHDEVDHVPHANVLVSHMEEGIEVIHLYTGRPLCQIPLPEGVHGDVNGDGVIDHLEVFHPDRESAAKFRIHTKMPWSKSMCFLRVTTGIPTMASLFNSSVCTEAGGFLSRALGKGEQREVTAPLLLERYDLTESYKPSANMDIFVAVSDGRVLALDGQGQSAWNSRAGAPWTIAHDKTRKGKAGEDEFARDAMAPAVEAYRLDATHYKSDVLVVGEDRVVALDSATGELLVEASLPEPPVAPVVVGDINNDGLNDLIVPTRSAYHVYTLDRLPSSMAFRFFAGAVLLVLLSILSTRASKGKRVRAGRRL